MSTTLLLAVQPNDGYAPEQVTSRITLGELLEAVQDAIADYGEDAEIVTSNGQTYGAQYGYLVGRSSYDLFEEVCGDDDQ